MRISDWSSDVCSSDLAVGVLHQKLAPAHHAEAGTYLVAELPLDVVERARQVAIASGGIAEDRGDHFLRSEEHTSELQSLMRISYAVFCLKKKKSNAHDTK